MPSHDQTDRSFGLELHDSFAGGDHIRIDHPLAVEMESVPEAHLAFNLVQHVESYDPHDFETTSTELVIVEDRSIDLDDQPEISRAEDAPLTDQGADTIEIDSAEAEIDADAGEQQASDPPEPEIETTWGFDVGDDRPDIGTGASVTMVDEEAGDQTHVAVITPESVPAASEQSIRALFGVEFGLPASTDLQELKPGMFPVGVPGGLDGDTAGETPAPTVETQDKEATAVDGTDEGPSGDDEASSCPDDSFLNNRLQVTTGSDRTESEPLEPGGEDMPADEEYATLKFQSAPQLDSTTAGAAAPESTDGTFAAAWEVDAFCWPDVCAQLDTAADGQLRESGAEIAAAARQGLKVLAVTSVYRDEGRTTLAMSLARHAAAAGCRVALLDADMAKPDLAEQLGLESPCNWHVVASQQQSLAEAAVYSLEDGVTLFPLTAPLSREFDLVVMDLYPMEVHAVPVLRDSQRSPIDMAVVVRDIRSTSEQRTLETVQKLRNAGVKAVGIAENYRVT
jgi:Mrp family chromosome partitioning ATPase